MSDNKVLAVLGDTRAGARLIACSVALAWQRRSALELVYVESEAALAAAALPFCLTLAHAGAAWSAFAPPDVERGFRAQMARLQSIAERAAAVHAVGWSLRRMRAAFVPDAALELLPLAPLVLAAPALSALVSAGNVAIAPRRVTVALTGSDTALDERCLQAARDAGAVALRRVQAVRLGELQGLDGDLLVLPQSLATRALLAGARVPVLLVA